ncbi:MAG: nuclear transport factor 2 family protein [Stenotrophomonas sp.]
MQMQKYEERLRVAMLQSDVAALDELIDDDLMFVGPGGEIFTKQDDLQLHRSGTQRLSQADWLAVEVRHYGAVCITVVTAQLSGTFLAEPFSGRFPYVRTWAEREGIWRVVAGSVSVIAAERS